MINFRYFYKSKYVVTFIVIIFFTIIYSIIASDNYSISVDSNNISSKVIKDNFEKIMDESYNYKGKFTYGPCIFLKRGVYLAEINFETNTNENTFDIYSKDIDIYSDSDGIIKSGFLSLNKTSQRILFSLKSSVRDLEIRTYYDGVGFLKVKSIEIRSLRYAYILKNILQVTLVFSLAIFLILIKKIITRLKLAKEDIIVITIISFIIIFSSYPLFWNYIKKGHDLYFHLGRIMGVYNGLISGQFPVRIYNNHLWGYGYASPIFYGDIFLYIPAILKLITGGMLSLSTCYKIFLFLINISTAIISYYVFYKMFHSKYSGVIGSILYTLSLYRLNNMYIRAALGETLAMTFIPLIILGLYYILFDDSRKWGIATIGYTFVLQSHMISTSMCLLFSLALAIIFIKRFKEKERLIVLIKSSVTTLLLNL